MTDEEFFEKLDGMKSEQTKQLIKEHAGKTADELFGLAMSRALTQEQEAKQAPQAKLVE